MKNDNQKAIYPSTAGRHALLGSLLDYCDQLRSELDIVLAENANLKAKLASRDLNLAHLTDLLDQIEDVKS